MAIFLATVPNTLCFLMNGITHSSPSGARAMISGPARKNTLSAAMATRLRVGWRGVGGEGWAGEAEARSCIASRPVRALYA